MNRRQAAKLQRGAYVYRQNRCSEPEQVGRVLTATSSGEILVMRLQHYRKLKEKALEDWDDVELGREWWGHLGVFQFRF
jgi:hypothetical protein